MRKNKLHLKILLGIIWILGIISVLSSCGKQTENQFGKVMSEEEICSHIRHMKKKINDKLSKDNYKKNSIDSSNINLSKNCIKDRTIFSWYEEEYVNEKGTLITITYSVENSALWLEIEVKGTKGDFPIEEYKMAVFFYKEFTNGNIEEHNIYKMLGKTKIGEYRIDSDNYPDVFVFEVNANKSFGFFLAGIVN